MTSDDVDNFLANYTPEVQLISLRLRELVLEITPEAIEQIDLPAKMLAYGLAKTYKDMICVIMPLNGAVNLGFPRGTDLPDPDKLLEGTGKKARHVKITALGQVGNPAIRLLIEQSLGQIR
jgi:hypothetical protein